MKAAASCSKRSFSSGQALFFFGLFLTLAAFGAHFYRAGDYGLSLGTGLIFVFICLKPGWKHYAAAFFLLWGMVEWGGAALELMHLRQAMGLPWLRGALILAVVALLTGLAGAGAYARAGRLTAQDAHARFQALVFIAAFLCLFYLRQASPLKFLLLERYWPLGGSLQIFFAAWYAAFVAGKLSDPKQSRKFRPWLWLIFGTVFFAQFALGLLGLERMLLSGGLHAPIPAFIIFAPLFRESLSMMPLIVLAATLLTGSAWCGLLCYFGPFDALAAGRGPVRPPSPFLSAALRYGRWVVLGLGLAGTLALKAAGISAATAAAIAFFYALASVAVMACWSRRHFAMTHCCTVCPMGLAVNLLGRLSPWRLRVDKELCDDCGACEKVCRYYAITPESRARGGALMRCSLCRDCLGVCRKGALTLRCPGLSPALAGSLFTGLSSVLHAVFLSVAMV